MTRRLFAGAFVLLVSGLITVPALADDAVPDELPRHHPRILETADIITTVETPPWQVIVDQRFFNLPGSEQRGLRGTTSLEVADGAEYLVPGAGDGYEDVDCADVDISIGDGVIAQGAGTWTASESGVHLVCYRMVTPGGPGPGGPGTDEPQVLDVALARDGTNVRDHVAAGTSSTRVLASTDASISLVAASALVMLLAGLRLRRPRRRTSDDR